MTKALPLSCVVTAFVAKALPLPCVVTTIVAKTRGSVLASIDKNGALVCFCPLPPGPSPSLKFEDDLDAAAEFVSRLGVTEAPFVFMNGVRHRPLPCASTALTPPFALCSHLHRKTPAFAVCFHRLAWPRHRPLLCASTASRS